MVPELAFSPLAWGTLVAVATALAWPRLRRGARAVAVAVLVLLVLACAPLGANALVWLAESQASADRCTPLEGAPVVVLSGGFHSPPAAETDYSALNEESLRRLQGGIEVWRERGTGPLVIAGGGPFAIKESAMLARLASSWGVDAGDIHQENVSRTTWGSAQSLRAQGLPQRVILVTSALHLPRADIAFRAAGFESCPHATDSRLVRPWHWSAPIPRASSVHKAERAIYELCGRLAYRWKAWRAARNTDAATG